MKKIDVLMQNEIEVLQYLKNHFPLYHLSNIFLRDLQYGIMKYFEESRRTKLRYPEAEKIAREFAEYLEGKELFKRLNHQSWVLQYPEFVQKAS
jgi:ribonucleotide reductase alpha subunit